MTAAYRVLLKHIPTGETVEVDHGDEWGEAAEYLWTEGNFACDCNRALLFAHAKELPAPEPRTCSDDQYIAIRAIGPDGWVLELEGEHWTPEESSDEPAEPRAGLPDWFVLPPDFAPVVLGFSATAGLMAVDGQGFSMDVWYRSVRSLVVADA